jgi:hypothetical protein
MKQSTSIVATTVKEKSVYNDKASLSVRLFFFLHNMKTRRSVPLLGRHCPLKTFDFPPLVS